MASYSVGDLTYKVTLTSPLFGCQHCVPLFGMLANHKKGVYYFCGACKQIKDGQYVPPSNGLMKNDITKYVPFIMLQLVIIIM